MIKPRCNLHKRAFSLTELMVTLGVAMILATAVIPTMAGTIERYRFKTDVFYVRSTISRAMNHSLAEGGETMVTFAGNTITSTEVSTGDVLDSYTLETGVLGRNNGSSQTPWLGQEGSGASSFTADQILISPNGLVAPPGGAVFLSIDELDGVIEVLPNGKIDVFYQTKGASEWAR